MFFSRTFYSDDRLTKDGDDICDEITRAPRRRTRLITVLALSLVDVDVPFAAHVPSCTISSSSSPSSPILGGSSSNVGRRTAPIGRFHPGFSNEIKQSRRRDELNRRQRQQHRRFAGTPLRRFARAHQHIHIYTHTRTHTNARTPTHTHTHTHVRKFNKVHVAEVSCARESPSGRQSVIVGREQFPSIDELVVLTDDNCVNNQRHIHRNCGLINQTRHLSVVILFFLSFRSCFLRHFTNNGRYSLKLSTHSFGWLVLQSSETHHNLLLRG